MDQKSNKFAGLIAKLTLAANNAMKKKDVQKTKSSLSKRDLRKNYSITQLGSNFQRIKFAD